MTRKKGLTECNKIENFQYKYWKRSKFSIFGLFDFSLFIMNLGESEFFI